MKKNQLVDEPKNELVKMILKNQESMKVTLNGGKYQLDDATIPFQIGFTAEIAEKKPSHILVLDITKRSFDRKGKRYEYDSVSERTLFKMEPVHYLQLKEPGEHHLIFILLDDMTSKKRKWLLERSYSGYGEEIYFESIEDLELSDQVAYCESIVNVPDELFAHKSETFLGKAVWAWVNDWYTSKPVDQCEYRKRKIFAFTIKPILWAILFGIRLAMAVIYTTFSFIARIFGLIGGYQAVSFFPNLKETWWEFLILYSGTEYDDFVDEDYWFGYVLKNEGWDLKHKNEVDWYPKKTLFLFGKYFHYPISLSALLAYTAGFGIYYFVYYFVYSKQIINSIDYGIIYLLLVTVLSFVIAYFMSKNLIPTILDKWEWEDYWTGRRIKVLRSWIFYPLSSFGILALLIPKIRLINFSNLVTTTTTTTTTIINTVLIVVALVIVAFIITLLFRKVIYNLLVKVPTDSIEQDEDVTKKTSAKELKRISAEEKRINWLKTGFDINNIPDKVDLKTMPEPSVVTHKLVINFWRTKAKVCKPYAKK